MKINNLLQVVLIIGFSYMYISVIFLDNNNSEVNIYLLLLMSGYIIFLIYLLNYQKDNGLTGLILMFVFYSIVWIVLRGIVLVGDINLINYQYLIDASTNDLVFTMSMIFISSICLVVGLHVGYKTTKIHNIKSNKLYIPNKIFFNFTILYFFIVLIILAIIKQYITLHGSSYIIGLVSIIFSIEVIFLIFMYVLFTYWQNATKKDKILIGFMIILFVAIRLLGGSKGALFALVMYSIIIFSVINSRFYINKKILLFGIFMLPIAYILFYTGQGMRLFLASNIGTDVTISYIIENLDNIIEIGKNSAESYGGIFEMISRRLSMLDYMQVMFNKDTIHEYIYFPYQFKVIINIISPGLPFEDASLFSALLFKATYGYTTYAEVMSNYHSDMLPFFGWSFVNFSAFSFLIIIVVGFIFGKIYKIIENINSEWSWFYKIVVIYIFSSTIFGMGLDATFQQLLFNIMIPFIVFRLVYFFYKEIAKKNFVWGIL